VTPLFLARGSSLFVFSQRDSNPTPQSGDRLIVLVGPLDDEHDLRFGTEDSLLQTAEMPGGEGHDRTDPDEAEPDDATEIAEGNEVASPRPIEGDGALGDGGQRSPGRWSVRS
jgi:hypothetical protein